MLKIRKVKYHKVRLGQTVKSIARHYSCAERLLVKENGLKGQPFEGQILKIPSVRGHLYTVKDGDKKELLSGSEESYERKNGTDVLYPGMEVLL